MNLKRLVVLLDFIAHLAHFTFHTALHTAQRTVDDGVRRERVDGLKNVSVWIHFTVHSPR